MTKKYWKEQAGSILIAKLKRKKIKYNTLAKMLNDMNENTKETEHGIAAKLSRGTFSFIFFLQCMRALGMEYVEFELEPYKQNEKEIQQ